MKITCTREALLTGLQTVIGVVERRHTMPILSNLLLKTGDNQIFIIATDLELEIDTKIPVTVEQSGEITIPARKLFDICRGLPPEANVQIELDKHQVRISSGRSRFVLSTLPAEEFPFLGEVAGDQTLTLPQSSLKQLFDRTCFAMAQHDVRYYLNGLLLVMQGQTLRAVATDGHRLALSEIKAQSNQESPAQIIVPRKAVTELLRVLDAKDDEITLVWSSNHLQVRVGTNCFTSKLIDGRFPDYDRVIPETGDKIVVGDRELMRQALGRAAILSNEKFKGVRLSLSENQMRVQTHNPEHEEAQEEFPVEYSNESVDIGFNVTYLMDALSALDAERFCLELAGPDSSGLIRAEGDDSSQYVVMPMRL